METYSQCNYLSFLFQKKKQQQQQQRNNQKIFLVSLRKIYSARIAFCCFAFKTKLLNLFSSISKKPNFEFKHDFQDICSLMMKVIYTVHKLWYFKKTDLYTLFSDTDSTFSGFDDISFTFHIHCCESAC